MGLGGAGRRACEDRLGAGGVGSIGAHHQAVARTVDPFLDVVLIAEQREREHAEVVGIQGGDEVRKIGHEAPLEVHPGRAVGQGVRGTDPVLIGRVWVRVREKLRPFLEYGLDLRVGPVLLAGQEALVESLAVHPHVQDVEGAHCRPAVLVAGREGDKAIGLHLRCERHEIGEGGRDRVTLRGEEALLVHDDPRVGPD